MAIRRSRLLLLISFIVAVLASLCVPTVANAAVETGTACGQYDPATRELIVRISATGFTGGATPSNATAVNSAGEGSSGVRTMSHDATTGAVSIEVVIPSSSINSGTWKVYGIFDGDPNSEDLLTSGTFGACLGAPGVGAYCADVLFIGVRGSGQTASDAGGYGNELNYVRAGIVSYMPSNKQVEAVALDYTAASVPSLFAPRGGITNFFASIDNGVTLLRERLRYAQIACGDQKVVLAGYSQGALVVNMVARNARNVVGVLLVADPGRVPNQASRNLGSARSGSGIYRLTGIDLGRISTPRNARVVELCNARDIICDWSNAGVPRAALTGAATAPAAVSFATGVHMAYPATASNQLIELGREGVLAAGLIPRP